METFTLIVALLATAVVIVAVIILRAGQTRALDMAHKMNKTQAELTGRLAQMGEAQINAQAQVNLTLEQRLDAVSKRIGDGLNSHTEKTGKSMGDLNERLAVIDAAQKNLTDLSQQVVGLQDILSNKQARGAFGEVQLNDLVSSISTAISLSVSGDPLQRQARRLFAQSAQPTWLYRSRCQISTGKLSCP